MQQFLIVSFLFYLLFSLESEFVFTFASFALNFSTGPSKCKELFQKQEMYIENTFIWNMHVAWEKGVIIFLLKKALCVKTSRAKMDCYC